MIPEFLLGLMMKNLVGVMFVISGVVPVLLRPSVFFRQGLAKPLIQAQASISTRIRHLTRIIAVPIGFINESYKRHIVAIFSKPFILAILFLWQI